VTSPTQRSLAHARAEGWTAAIAERWNPYAKIRQDLLGWIDLIVLRDGEIVGVQTTSGSNHAARRTKILASPTYDAWRRAGGKAEVWTWAKRGPRGKRKAWSLRVEAL